LEQRAYPIDVETLQSLQNNSISLQHNSPHPSATLAAVTRDASLAADGTTSSSDSGDSSTSAPSLIEKPKETVEAGHAQVIEVTVTRTESPSTLSLAIMCAFPTTNPDGSWAGVHKKKNISLGAYDMEKDDPLALAKEIVQHVPDFQKCENRAAMEGVVSAELSNMIAPFVAAWQSHRTLAESSLHEKAELAALEKKRVHNNYEGLVKVLQNELDFNPEWVNSFIEEQITLEDLLIIEEVDILKLVPRMGPRRRLLMYIQGMKEKAAASHGSTPEAASPLGSRSPLATPQLETIEDMPTAPRDEDEQPNQSGDDDEGDEEARGPEETDGPDVPGLD
jgi:hypothetical protein